MRLFNPRRAGKSPWNLRERFRNAEGNIVAGGDRTGREVFRDAIASGACKLLLVDASVWGTAMPVLMKLSRILIAEISDQQVIWLKEVDGDRSFPIVIGVFEASSIDQRVKGKKHLRPLTHDLVLNVIHALGGEPQDVIITELRDHTYYAKLRIRHQGELVEVDSRPSDAIAVAVTCQPPLPIYVNEDVLEMALRDQI